MLERAVPKNRGVEFLDLIEELANDTCLLGAPDCPRCELRKLLRVRRVAQARGQHARPVQLMHAKQSGVKSVPAAKVSAPRQPHPAAKKRLGQAVQGGASRCQIASR